MLINRDEVQSERPSIRTAMAKSSLTGGAQFLTNTALVFITIPMFVRILGAEAYGVFSLVTLLGSLNTFANLGLNSSLVRFLAKQGKTQESDLDIIVTCIILVCILLPLTVTALVFQDGILLHVFGIPATLISDGRWLFIATMAGNVLVLLGQTFTAILDSQQKIYMTNAYLMIYSFVYWGLILLAILCGLALKGVAVATLIAVSIWFCIVFTSALRSWGGLSSAGIRSNGLRIAKKQLSYGMQIYAGGVLGFFHEPITKILVSRLVGVPQAGIFDIALRVRNQLVGLVTKLLSPLYPAISQIKDTEKLKFLVHDVEQKTFLLGVPIVGIIVLAARPLVSLVFHSNLNAISLSIVCVVCAYILCSTTVLPIYLYLMARGFPARTIVVQAVNVLVNALVLFALIPTLGYYSAVASNVVAIASSFVLLLFFQRELLGSIIFDNLQQFCKMTLTFLLAIGCGYVARTYVGGQIWILVSVPAVVLAVTFLLYRYFGLISKNDLRRYLGQNNAASRFAYRLFFGGPMKSDVD